MTTVSFSHIAAGATNASECAAGVVRGVILAFLAFSVAALLADI
jgi:hypothetical protein